MSDIIANNESRVRWYCRNFPAVFTEACGEHLWDEYGNQYVDLFAAAGSLNYGHNQPTLQKTMIDTIVSNHLVQSLDLFTPLKENFIAMFNEIILAPRNLQYKYQFVGPTGASAIEAAMILAKKLTGKNSVICFERSFHGMTLGARSISGSLGEIGENVRSLPFFGENHRADEAIAQTKQILEELPDTPGAMFIESVQAEGGVFVANRRWLKFIVDYCADNCVVSIMDDIQCGCGRTGSFFSFDTIEIKPSIVCLSKSLSGIGLPMAMLLIAPELDIWKPGEFSGTFRGNGLAFAAAAKALEFWRDHMFLEQLQQNICTIENWAAELSRIKTELGICDIRGVGMIWGIEYESAKLAKALRQELFAQRIIAEFVGKEKRTLKILAPLNIDQEVLKTVLKQIVQCSSNCRLGKQLHL